MTDTDIQIYLDRAFRTNDPKQIVEAMGVVAREKGITELAQETGLCREQLYKTLGKKGNPTLKSLLAIMSALGMQIHVTKK